MNWRLLAQTETTGCENTYVLIFDTGDEVKNELFRFARKKEIHSDHFTAIGAFSSVVLGYFVRQAVLVVASRISSFQPLYS